MQFYFCGLEDKIWTTSSVLYAIKSEISTGDGTVVVNTECFNDFEVLPGRVWRAEQWP